MVSTLGFLCFGTLNRLKVSEQSVMLLRALHIVIRIFLVLACAFWALILLEILPPLVVSGLDGARGKLVHIWSMGRLDLSYSCADSLQLLHEGYTDLIILLLLTWTLVELNRFLHRRIAALSRVDSIPTEGTDPCSFDSVSARKP